MGKPFDPRVESYTEYLVRSGKANDNIKTYEKDRGYESPKQNTPSAKKEVNKTTPTPSKKSSYVPLGMGVPEAQTANASRPIIDPNQFAYRPGEMQKVGDMRQAALQGFSGGELAKRREGFQQPIETSRLAALRSLGRQQERGNVKGGIAYAQTRDINRQSAQASANAGRDLTLANENYKRQALNDLQGFLGKERYGQFASTLAGRQLGVQEQAAGQQNQQYQAMLDYLRNRNPEEIGDGNIGERASFIPGGSTVRAGVTAASPVTGAADAAANGDYYRAGRTMINPIWEAYQAYNRG